MIILITESTFFFLAAIMLDIGYENMASIGLISSLPHLCAFIAEPICGIVNDTLRTKSSLGRNRVRDFFKEGIRMYN